tara:strand:- start:5754 stop:6554 length:801 start_codon:yes stop_codon:yes gene_type:complete
MSKNRIKVKDTVCKGCIFAQYDDVTQTGCRFDIVDNAKKANIQVLECYDDEREFFVLKDRQCMLRRPHEWVKGKKQVELADIAQAEVAIPCKAIVLMEIQTPFEAVKKTIDDLAAQTMKPNYVSIVRPHDNKHVTPKQIADHLGTCGFAHWKVENIMDRKRLERKAIDLVMHFKTHPYTACFRAGLGVSEDFFQSINDKIIYHFFNFGILTNDKDKVGVEPIHGVVVPHVVWANYGNSIQELENCLKEDKCQNKIIQIQEVVPKFQ